MKQETNSPSCMFNLQKNLIKIKPKITQIKINIQKTMLNLIQLNFKSPESLVST